MSRCKSLRAILSMALALCLAAHSMCLLAAGDVPAMRVVAYVMGWTTPPEIAAEKLTHVNYAFARIDAGGRVTLPDPAVAAQLAQLRALKKRNPALKVMLSVGGWEAEGFSDAALTPQSRDVFARSAVALLREHQLDGIDLDWEYPGQGVAGIRFRPEDKQNFTLLLQALREQLDRAGADAHRAAQDRYLLTIASADREYFVHTEMDRLHVYLDWINVMSYDFFNSLTPTTGHLAGLYRSRFAAARIAMAMPR